ncbi:MAG: hypothetical protein ABRQ29_10405, partial [Smithellaceae bacterium]
MADAGMNREMALLGKLIAVMAADAGKPPSRAIVRRRIINLLQKAKAEGEYSAIVSAVVMFAGIG